MALQSPKGLRNIKLEHMGRKRKYATVEEAKAAQREQARKFREKKTKELGRSGVTNPCKHKRFKETGLRVDIGTMNRTKLDTAYIEIVATVTYINDQDILNKFKTEANKTFVDWLNHQDMWDRKNRIAVMDYDSIRKYYNGTYKTLTFQFHIRRDVPTEWKETAENLTGLSDAIIGSIKKTCRETGLELIEWNPNPRGRKSAASKLSDAPSPDASEVD